VVPLGLLCQRVGDDVGDLLDQDLELRGLDEARLEGLELGLRERQVAPDTG
jgi:hypothetical protein